MTQFQNKLLSLEIRSILKKSRIRNSSLKKGFLDQRVTGYFPNLSFKNLRQCKKFRVTGEIFQNLQKEPSNIKLKLGLHSFQRGGGNVLSQHSKHAKYHQFSRSKVKKLIVIQFSTTFTTTTVIHCRQLVY